MKNWILILKNMSRTLSLLLITVTIATHLHGQSSGHVIVTELKNNVTIQNSLMNIEFDLLNGTYSAKDKKQQKYIINGAYFSMALLKSTDKGFKHSWTEQVTSDELGVGKTLTIRSKMANMPDLLFQITLYATSDYMILNGGLDNQTDFPVKLQNFHVLIGNVYNHFPVNDSYFVLDGNSGGEETRVRTDKILFSRNNVMAKFGKGQFQQTFVCGGVTYHEFEKFVYVRNDDSTLYVDLLYEDPVGKKIDPGTRYIPNDKLYVSFMTKNPFEALEEYGLTVRTAQKINLDIYSFPTVCLWYASVPYYGGGPLINDTKGAVWEADNVVKSGFLNYSKVGIRLVPDNYEQDNQQGWWDDKHWQIYGEQVASTLGPHYKKPYETTKKWGDAITQRGCIPFTYFQGARRSEDFCHKYPGYMLFNESDRIAYNQNENKQWWNKIMKWSYDYTDPGFIRHMQKVYANLRDGGIQGIMFDYVDQTGWAFEGGFEDKYATTSYAYRNLFKLAADGLGSSSYINERNLDRGSDITLGVTTSHRTWGDTDKSNPYMISRCGLRWYKNRVVINYDMDSKNPNRVIPANSPDGYRSMFTMAYVVSGRLLLGCSFSKLSKDQLYSLSRVIPFHKESQSARPVDAFSGSLFPQIYDFIVNEKWHQLTLYNTKVDTLVTKKKDLFNSTDHVAYLTSEMEVDLGNNNSEGGLQLKTDKYYYFFDFWNNQFLQKLKGNEKLKQTLRPGEARMISIHEVESNPQFISTNRHIMQGFVDLKNCKWDSVLNQLSGESQVVKNDDYKIIIASNGMTPSSSFTNFGKATIIPFDAESGLYEITLNTEENRTVKWVVQF